MKLYINARFLTQPISGVQRYGIECSRKIKKLHPEVVFLAPKNVCNSDVASELGARIIGTNTGHLWEQSDLPRFLKKQGMPPLFNPCNTAPLLYNNNYITLHDLAFYHHPEWNSRLFSLWYNTLVPRIVRKCKKLFTVSNSVRNEIALYANVPVEDIEVTFNGISQRMLEMRAGSPVAKEKIILAVGSFNVRKNHHSLINAFVASEMKKDYRLIIVGDKNKVFRDTGINEDELTRNNIQVYKHMAEDDLINMYQKAGIVVSLSVYEGFGIPLLEGIFNGCKVVCSDIPVYRELYDGFATFCQPFDLDGIAQAINTAANVPRPDDASVSKLLEKYNYGSSAQTILNAMLSHGQ